GGLVRNLVVIIFLNALLEMLLPQGEFRRYIRLLTGLIVILMVVGTIATLLGRAPRLEPAFGGESPAAALGEPGGGQAEKLELTGRRHLLEQCRAGLEQVLREELAAAGGWELVEAALVLDEDPASAAFGAPREIFLLVRRRGGAAAGVEPVEIIPVRPGEAAPGEEGAGAGERQPALEKALADLLELSLEKVTVAAVGGGRGD
ncbi:MAG: stage III sporulation protein AF, partial [Firmicutes bacterium]|nr:stage III sporulation protein AF [Bacillota bacterium]